MKKLLTLLAALTIFGCQKNDLNYQEQNLESKIFIATIETGETKTSLNTQGNVLWKKDDEVSIFAGSTSNKEYKVTDDSDGKTHAELTPVSSTNSVTGNAMNNNVAFYPYTSSASISAGESNYFISNITLPSTQNYAEGSFGNGAFPMAAVTSSTAVKNLTFKNVLGGLKLQLKGTASIVSIQITGNNNEILYGAASITASNSSNPSIVLTDASARTVILNCGDGVPLNSSTVTSFIIALPPVTMSNGFTVVVTDTDGGSMTIKTENEQTISRSKILKMPEKTYHGYVDLGLSVKWATCNVGASTPSDYGYYFAWGETSSKDEYSWTTYTLCNGTNITLTKYVTSSSYGTVDNKTVLEASDDAATANWGSNWRMPTHLEWQELYNSSNCTWEWTTEGGHHGYKVTSKSNSNSIFLPAAGYYNSSSSSSVDNWGRYWSSSLNTSCSYAVNAFYFYSSDKTYEVMYGRSLGQSVRPVSSSSQN